MNKATAVVSPENTSTLINFLSNDVTAFIIKLVGAVFIVVIVMLVGRLIGAIVKKNLLRHADPAYKKHAEKVALLIQNIIFWVATIFAIFIGCEMM
jgi:flagellar biosynthesis protein FlhB